MHHMSAAKKVVCTPQYLLQPDVPSPNVITFESELAFPPIQEASHSHEQDLAATSKKTMVSCLYGAG